MNDKLVAKYLSWPLAATMPVYGDPQGHCVIVAADSQIKGDSCNTYNLSFNNHVGTHVDCPAHFFSGQTTVIDYPPEHWLYKKIALVNLEVAPGYYLQSTDLPEFAKDSELLLLRTNWTARRSNDEYSLRNPGLHEELASYLRREYPALRAVGMDFLSVSSFAGREMGRLAHQAFLDEQRPGRALNLIEDMYLPAELDGNKLSYLWVAPLLMRGIDSAPCTVTGFFSQ